jgi:ectoine hydroxylase-related dioxygenase (phytanoyl-CoA dioxygenase family)
MAMTEEYRRFRESGFAIFKAVFPASRIAEILQESDRLRGRGATFNRTEEDGDVRWLVVSANGSAPVLRGVQNAHRVSRLLDALRLDPAVFEILAPLLGGDITTLLTSLFWKPPGEPLTGIAYHQDCVFRRPRESFRNLATSYVQLGIALDPHAPANGGMSMFRGSHKLGDLPILQEGSVLLKAPTPGDIDALGLSPADEVDVVLDPGDVVIWTAHTLHGSRPNMSATLDRRFFVVTSMRTVDCDAGEPAFRAGRPCPFRGDAVPG